MNGRWVTVGVALVGLLLALTAGLALAQGPEPPEQTGGPDVPAAPVSSYFTYQGFLKDNGAPANGHYNFRFNLYPSLTGGTSLLGSSYLYKSHVNVVNGLFTVQLDFNSVAGKNLFTGDARYMEIAVEIDMIGASYTVLSPRQELTAAPYAFSLKPGATIHNKATSGGIADMSGLVLQSDSADGLHVDSAAGNGVHVDYADGNGFYVGDAGHGGVVVTSAQYNGFHVDFPVGDGLHVTDAGDDGVEVGLAGGHGLYVVNAGNNGVRVDAAVNTGVYANTNQTSHNYGLYTPDNLYSLNYHLAGAMMLVAQSGDSGNLEPGDVVAVSGTGAVFAEGESPVALVRRAGPGDGAVMGVVYRRYVAEKNVQEVKHDGKVEQRTSVETRSADGPIAPGDYLLVVVMGPAQVKVVAAAGLSPSGGAGLRPGDLLIIAPNGQATKATSETTSYAPGTIIGQAMGALDLTQSASLVWVLVMPR